ncbi:ABC transporter ATP-binding protein [Cellulomonas endometrii]|uniref:ABC transporter ATP-binding protein n=1 Tax=Cellulomonas endometrii TaxID=3036301 RepID=UPI0024AD8B62|nr:ATP-binding cassette domain-containing protein [Cellulomonas endometrii]
MQIEASHVVKRYAGRAVVNDVSVTAAAGSLSVLSGPSGSGKSTLLGILGGFADPDEGKVTRDPADLGVAWVAQNSPVLLRRSVLDNVALGTLSRGADHDEARTRSMRALDALGMERLAGSPAYALSGGERQRLAVARALVADSPALIADEPTASLDPASRDLVLHALVVARDAGAVVLVATHDRLVTELADTLWVMHDGIVRTASAAPTR